MSNDGVKLLVRFHHKCIAHQNQLLSRTQRRTVDGYIRLLRRAPYEPVDLTYFAPNSPNLNTIEDEGTIRVVGN